jgi:thiamine-phosphate pyrophosphorylase
VAHLRGLYAIIDGGALAARGLEAVAFAEALLAARPAAIQLRDKRGPARETLALLGSLQERAAAWKVPLFANDRADLALLAGCHGVHLGQDDVPPAAVRRLAGGERLVIGISVHDERELGRALDEQADYLALGAVFATASKERPAPVLGLDGLDALASSARRASRAPLVGIGGIGLATAGEVGRLCDAVAVIGALLPPPEEEAPYAWVTERAAALHAAACGGGC